MSEKKPSHVVVVEMIKETIEAIGKEDGADILQITAQMGILSAELEMLKRMIIPEEHHAEVIESLRQIKTYSLGNAKELLPDMTFLAISSPTENKKA